ncbi:MAG TPA: response regulator [Holophaga sp.]|nr:response regulator [Holophaga sp.]
MNQQTILIVDDNPDDVELTLRVLQSHRIANNIQVARDGVEAIEFLKGLADHDLPSLVLLDLKMPRMDGLETLDLIRKAPHTKHLPVVIMTTSREERDVAASYALGANGYVQKPVEFEEFEHAVHYLGLYWLILNVAPRP